MRVTQLVKPVAVGSLLIASVSGCGGSPYLSTALDCSSIIGPSLRADVQDVPPPEENTVGGWVAVADGRSQRIDDANGRKNAVIENVDWCAVQQKRLADRPWYTRLLPG